MKHSWSSTYTDIDWQSVDWTKNDSELGRELGRSRERVRQKRVGLGMPKPVKRPKGWRAELNDLDTSGFTVKELTERFGKPDQTIRGALTELNKPFQPAGEINARLGELQELHSQGLTYYAIAKEMGISYNVARIKLMSMGLESPDTNYSTGIQGEQSVCERLRELGLPAKHVGTVEPYDVDCGGARIEVKTARLKNNGGLAWSVSNKAFSPKFYEEGYREYERDYANSCDFFVFVWAREEEPDWFWVAPVEEVLDKEIVYYSPFPKVVHQKEMRTWLESRRDRFDLISEFIGSEMTVAA